MLRYVSGRVLDEEAEEIHEHEVGHHVFGRSANYDTSSDNIVRVHASLLRKRLEQYFASDGANETTIVELPKGNYAPVFRKRTVAGQIAPVPVETMDERPRSDWRLRVAILGAAFFAATTLLLLLRPVRSTTALTPAGPNVRQFWAQIFPPGRPTDIVLDDAAVGLFQELNGRSLSLSDYFDRGYQRNLSETDSSIVLRRHASVSSTSFLWRVLQIPGVDHQRANLRFARDYSFRDLKADNAVLLGNARFNPWIEPFLPKLGVRWNFDNTKGGYYPVDTWGSFKSESNAGPRDGYFSVALLPNLAGMGSVLIVSGTGGSTLNAAGDFLADEHSLSELRSRLANGKEQSFPYFEALINVHGRNSQLRDVNIAICRAVK